MSWVCSYRRARIVSICLSAGSGSLLTAASVLAQSLPTFTDTTVSCGVAAQHAPAPNYFLSSLNTAGFTGAAAVADVNNDGFQDIYFVTSGSSPDKLFINNGDGTFTDRAAEWGITGSHMGISVSAADYNADGLIDFYITSLGPSSGDPQTGRHRLLRNNGSSFTNVATAAGVNRTTTILPDGFGSAWGDYDLDGDLDLFVTSWINNTSGNKLFRNNANGTFTDVTIPAGVRDISLRGYSPRFVDMDNDRFPELVVAGDFRTSRYFRNLANGSFLNATQASGTSIDDNGMGSAIGDFNNDGLFDWYVTSVRTSSPLPGVPGTGNMLYINQGNHFFLERSIPAGVNSGGWGWGTLATDFNHDSLQDIVATNGWYQPNGGGLLEWTDDPSRAFLNQGDLTFTEVGQQTGINLHTAQGRAMCAIDYDNDGDQDLFIVNYNNTCTMLRSNLIENNTTPPDAHWIRVALDTSDSRGRLAPQGIGSRLIISTDATTQHRYLNPGCTYIGQSEATAHFGLGTASIIDSLTIVWNNGRTTQIRDLPTNQTYTLHYCPPDWNGDNVVSSQDFLRFLDDFFLDDADYNFSGSTNSQDLYDFLVDFFSPCS